MGPNLHPGMWALWELVGVVGDGVRVVWAAVVERQEGIGSKTWKRCGIWSRDSRKEWFPDAGKGCAKSWGAA